ncbi:MAG: NADH-quinone oxidoreductase subunit NuoH [Chloroflexia bacterium]
MDWVFFLVRFLFAFILMNVALVIVAFLVYFERKVAAHMQARIGPNRAGPVGLLQSFADLIKMIKKETTIPSGADKWVFFAAPIVSTFTALGALSVVPFGPAAGQPGYINLFGQKISWFISDVSVGALVILAVSSLGVYGLIMAGWSSNSKYSLLGGLRSSSQVISYEITMGISLVGVFLLSGSLSLLSITTAQHPFLHTAGQPGLWFILLQPVAFMVFLTSAIAETNRTPFDLPEAESELVGGYHTEYSGIRFGLFFLSEYIAMVTVSALSSIAFLGGWTSPFAAFFDQRLAGGQLVAPTIDLPFISGALGSGPHWLIFKMAVFIFVYYWLRWTLPRFRYDQLMGLCWKVFLPVILLNIMVIALFKLIFFEPGLNLSNGSEWGWWVLVVIELAFGAAALYGFSSLAGLGWFGRAERPVLVEPGRELILVRTVQGGRGTIEGEARTVNVTRS